MSTAANRSYDASSPSASSTSSAGLASQGGYLSNYATSSSTLGNNFSTSSTGLSNNFSSHNFPPPTGFPNNYYSETPPQDFPLYYSGPSYPTYGRRPNGRTLRVSQNMPRQSPTGANPSPFLQLSPSGGGGGASTPRPILGIRPRSSVLTTQKRESSVDTHRRVRSISDMERVTVTPV